MQGGYRSARCCPACRAVLTELAAATASVDRCPDCAGLWIDWFDGEISSVASSIPAMAPAAPVAPATHACPDCRATLSLTRYPDEKSGAEIWRCGGCAGAFVPRSSLEAIVALGPPADPAPPAKAGLFAELLRLLTP